MKIKSILALLIFILVAIIFAQNTEVVEFKIYFWKLQMSRIVLYPGILILGFVIGYIVAKVNRRRNFQNKVKKIQEQSFYTEDHTEK
jgi:uncharacterized integral membrane protein